MNHILRTIPTFFGLLLGVGLPVHGSTDLFVGEDLVSVHVDGASRSLLIVKRDLASNRLELHRLDVEGLEDQPELIASVSPRSPLIRNHSQHPWEDYTTELVVLDNKIAWITCFLHRKGFLGTVVTGDISYGMVTIIDRATWSATGPTPLFEQRRTSDLALPHTTPIGEDRFLMTLNLFKNEQIFLVDAGPSEGPVVEAHDIPGLDPEGDTGSVQLCARRVHRDDKGNLTALVWQNHQFYLVSIWKGVFEDTIVQSKPYGQRRQLALPSYVVQDGDTIRTIDYTRSGPGWWTAEIVESTIANPQEISRLAIPAEFQVTRFMDPRDAPILEDGRILALRRSATDGDRLDLILLGVDEDTGTVEVVEDRGAFSREYQTSTGESTFSHQLIHSPDGSIVLQESPGHVEVWVAR